MEAVVFTNQASEIGLGCVTFGREIDKSKSFELMDYALANGIFFFDTAAAYGNGLSEEIVGAWLKTRSAEKKAVVIATKVLPPYTAQNICFNVEASIKRLGLTTIDILYLHRWDELLNNADAWMALHNLVMDGKVKALGVSNFNAVQLNNAIKLIKEKGLTSINFIQNNNNFAISDINEEIIETCITNDIKIVGFSPLAAGFLTGKHLQQIQKGSRFDAMPAHKDIYFNETANKHLRKILQVAEQTGYSAIQLSLSWALHQKNIYSVLVGGRTIAHLEQAFAARDFFSQEILTQLETE